MKKVLKKLTFYLLPKLGELIRVRDRLFKENNELRESIQILEVYNDGVFDRTTVRTEQCITSPATPMDYSVKVFDSKTIPGKN